MVEVFTALSRKGSQEVAEHSLVIVSLACMAVILTLGHTRGVGGGCGFLSFFLEGKASAPDVSSSCSFIPRVHFESSSVMFSFYDYEI